MSQTECGKKHEAPEETGRTLIDDLILSHKQNLCFFDLYSHFTIFLISMSDNLKTRNECVRNSELLVH